MILGKKFIQKSKSNEKNTKEKQISRRINIQGINLLLDIFQIQFFLLSTSSVII